MGTSPAGVTAVASSTACSGSRSSSGGTCAASPARMASGFNGPGGGGGRVPRILAISGCSDIGSGLCHGGGLLGLWLLAREDVVDLFFAPALAGDALQLVGDGLAGCLEQGQCLLDRAGLGQCVGQRSGVFNG